MKKPGALFWRFVLGFIVAILVASQLSFDSARPEVRAVVDRVNTALLVETVRMLSSEIGTRPTGSGANAEARGYLVAKLEEFGYDIALQPFEGLSPALPGRTLRGVNLIATKSAADDAPIVEYGAHFDTVPGSPGADDNGSGVAALLEVARVVADIDFEAEVRFLFLDAEEFGLVGSRAYVAALSEDERRRHEGFLDFEMVGYATEVPDSQDAPVRIPIIAWMPYTGNFILVAGNWSSGWVGKRFLRSVDLYVPELEVQDAKRIAGFFSDAARSDHSSYWESGLRAVMLTDTAGFRNPHYHRATDRLETVNPEFMTRVTKASVALLLEWAGAELPEPR